MKKFLTAFIFIFWFVSIASAGELITGAFGIKLGEPLDLNLVQGEIVDTFDDSFGEYLMQHLIHRENFDTLGDSNKFYGSKTAQVRPINPNPLFDSYRVWFTPTNKIVVGISGFGKIQSCGSESRGLKGILDKKYGKSYPDKSDKSDKSGNYSIWEDSKGRILKFGCNLHQEKLSMDAKKYNYLTVLYMGTKKEIDAPLKEREKLDIESVDPSGL